MLYENYQNKIQRIAEILRRIFRRLPIIIAAASVIFAAIIALTFSKGIITGVTFPESVEYGETFSGSASAFMSKATLEYSKKGENAWSAEIPVMPGEYDVRASAKAAFGMTRHGKTSSFTITPKKVSVTVGDSSVRYGDMPNVYAVLANKDRLVCGGVIYGDISKKETTVKADVSLISILDENGNDVTAAYEISAPESDVTVTERTLTIKVKDATHVYDGNEFRYEEYELGENTLLEGDFLQAVFEKSLTDAGTVVNTPTVRVFNKNGIDVTVHYELDKKEVGDLTVTKRPLVITTGSITATYTGKEITCPEYTMSPENTLAPGHMIVASSTSYCLNVGEAENVMRFRIIDEATGEDKTDNYSILVYNGTITVTPAPISVQTGSGSWVYDGIPHYSEEFTVEGLPSSHAVTVNSDYARITEAGTVENRLRISIFAGTREVTQNYEIHYSYGTLEVTKRKVTLKTGSYSWVYDGGRHIYFDVSVIGGDGLLPNHVASQGQGAYAPPTKYASITYVGTVPNEFEVSVMHNKTDVTGNYDISYVYGTLEITPRPITVAPEDVSKIYDGMPLSAENVYIAEGSLAETDSLQAALSGSRTNVYDTAVSRISSLSIVDKTTSEDRTANYKVTRLTGNITVEPRPVKITSASAEKIYDGKALTKNAFEVITDDKNIYDLVKGHTVVATATGSQTKVGESKNTYSRANVKIYNGSADVTRNYTFTELEYGTLEVKPIACITVRAASDSKKYDGKPLTNSNFEVIATEGNFNEKLYKVYAIVEGSITEVGTEDNIPVRIYVRGENGKDFTEGFIITPENGKLTVEPLAYITVTSASAEKLYDGRPLTKPEYTYEITSGALGSGHTVSARVEGSITKVGVTDNKITSVKVTDRNGNDVTGGYIISTITGRLRVYDKNSGDDDGSMDFEPSDAVFGKIKTDVSGVLYLRMKSYGAYAGTSVGGKFWKTAAAYGKLIDGKYSYNYLTSIAMQNASADRYSAEFSAMKLYMLPYYVTADGRYTVPKTDTDYTSISDTSYTAGYYNMLSLYAELDLLKGNLGEYANDEELYRKFVYANYLGIDAETKAFMDSVIAEEGFDASDKNIITKVASYVRHAAKYDLKYDRAMDSSDNVAVSFLRDYKKGICVHYATAGTLLFRALGIPARYVEGFMIETEAGKTVDIKNPGHAWVEVYIDGIGWIQVEVTGSSGSGGSGSGGGLPDGFTVQPFSYSKQYDGKPLVPKNEIEEYGNLKTLLDLGYTYEVTVSGSQTKIGASDVTIKSFRFFDKNGKDVTSSFNIEYKKGKLTVSEGLISIYLYETHKYYDGKAIAIDKGDYEIISGLPDGAELIADFHIPLVDAGEITRSELNANMDKYVTFTLYIDGKDVTSGYDFSFDLYPGLDSKYIPVTIEPRQIELTAASATKVYDGKPLSDPSVYLSMGTLVSGDRFTAHAIGEITDIGATENVIDTENMRITDKDGNDVTRNYKIKEKAGKLTVLPAE